jgi:serine/threonine protein kinase
LAYIAPEQLQGLRVDGRADQFSLAIIAYQMLSGARPFGAASEHSLMREIMSADPRPITEINSALGPRVTAVLRRALAKDPLLRFNTCSDMIRALKASIMEPEPEAAKPAVAPAPPPARKSNWIWIAGGVAALAVVAVVAIVFARSSAPRGPGVSVPHADVQQATTPAPPVASKAAITKSIPSPAVPAAAAPANRNPEARAVRPRTVDSQSNAPDFDNVHAAPRSKSSAPPALTPDQLKAKYEHDQKLATLDAKRQQLQTELLQAQRELVDLRTRYKDNAPEVQAAIERVQNLHTALTDVTNQVIDLKSQLGVHN